MVVYCYKYSGIRGISFGIVNLLKRPCKFNIIYCQTLNTINMSVTALEDGTIKLTRGLCGKYYLLI